MDIKKYKYKTELHAHTKPASRCGEIPPETVIKTYARLGYNSIVISNHLYPDAPMIEDKQQCLAHYLKDYDLAAETGKEYGINVILGCEIRFTENMNDYLLFGIDRNFISVGYDSLDMGIARFSEAFRSDEHLLIQAHPYRDHMCDVSPEYLDGVEVFNMHPGQNSRIGFAAKYAKENNFIVTCGTDYHHPGHEGMTAILTDREMKTSADIAEVLRSRDYLIEIGGAIVLPYALCD